MPTPFTKLPSTTRITPSPFTVNIPDEQLADFKTLLGLSKLGPQTYENAQSDRRFGVTFEWMARMKDVWLNDFDWRACESRVNSFPQYTTEIEGLTIHFAALFSEKPDAIPVVLLHGWPGSYFEFLPMLQLFRDEYTPSTLPYHLIVPSLPGYTFSSGPPLDKNFTVADTARVTDQLMKDLGFESGYVAQGGDIGSRVSRLLGVFYDSCKAVHLNFCPLPQRPKGLPSDEKLSDMEKRGLARWDDFVQKGKSYAEQHGTRPATIGHVLSASPLALLAWVGEKYLAWVDEPLPDQTILELITLYWFTDAFPRTMYPYRESNPIPPNATEDTITHFYIHKPFGFSNFPYEIMPIPKSWVTATGNVIFWRDHQKGGHFAALERPNDLKADLTEFIRQAWTVAG